MKHPFGTATVVCFCWGLEPLFYLSLLVSLAYGIARVRWVMINAAAFYFIVLEDWERLFVWHRYGGRDSETLVEMVTLIAAAMN